MAAVIVFLDLFQIDGSGDTGNLVELTRIVPEVVVVHKPSQVALGMPITCLLRCRFGLSLKDRIAAPDAP